MEYLHRRVMRALPGEIVDHINHDKLNNCHVNLRFCTHKQSNANQTKIKTARLGRTPTSKYKGVHFYKRIKRWKAQIWNDGKLISLGSFVTEIEAAVAYNKKALELRGEYAWLNII